MPSRSRSTASSAVNSTAAVAVRKSLGGARSRPRGVGRARVVEIQSARIVVAMSELVRERGAGGVTVAHVVQRSGVSRRTFYELFDDREDCFVAAFDAAVAAARERVLAAAGASGRWRERTRAALLAMLEFLDAEPDLGYLCVVGVLGGGQRALERRAAVLDSLVDAVHAARAEARGSADLDRLVAEGVVGAVLSVIHVRLLERQAGRQSHPLVGLTNSLMSIIVLPYLGPAAAQRESLKPAPRAGAPTRPRHDPLRELDMRLTYRTVRVLQAIASTPAASNREIATAAGIVDQGQISKLLARLQTLQLIEKTSGDHTRGEPNAWSLTPKGHDVTQTIQIQVTD
jgi:AcrR family transcriptional regulator